MSHNHGKRKTKKQRHRTPRQAVGVDNQRDPKQATPTESSEESSSASQPPVEMSRRVSRKEAAQAQAKKKRQLQILVGGVAAAIIITTVFILLNRPTGGGVTIDYSDIEIAQSEIVINQGTAVAEQRDGEISFSTGSTVGDPNAPVTLHIFSDFQCHYCKLFHDETLPLIVDDFVRDGRLKLVFHDFPQLGTDSSIADPNDLTVEIRDSNNQSAQAAHAAMCAGEQDQYVQMSDEIFRNYGGVQSGAYNRNNLGDFADTIGLNMDSFNACMESERYVSAIAQSIEQGQSMGVSGIPTFILDNGSGEFNVFQQTELGYELFKRQIEISIQTAP